MVLEAPTSLACQACGAPLNRDEIDDVRGVARCAYCTALTSLPNRARIPLRVRAARPRGVTVEESGRELRVVRRWFQPRDLVLLVFAIVWFGMLTVFFRMATKVDAPWYFRLFALIHVGVGCALLYVALAGILNRTEVRVDPNDILTVRNGPLPWGKDVEISGRHLAQVFCVAKLYERKDGPPQRLYSVCAITRQGDKIPLIGGLITDVDHVLYLEQVLEKHLGIWDRPVLGEIPRPGLTETPSMADTGP